MRHAGRDEIEEERACNIAWVRCIAPELGPEHWPPDMSNDGINRFMRTAWLWVQRGHLQRLIRIAWGRLLGLEWSRIARDLCMTEDAVRTEWPDALKLLENLPPLDSMAEEMAQWLGKPDEQSEPSRLGPSRRFRKKPRASTPA